MYSSNSNVGHSSGNSPEYQTEITDESECDDSPLISGAGTPPGLFYYFLISFFSLVI